MERILIAVLAFVVLAGMPGCTQMRDVEPVPAELARRIEPGDRVRVRTVDNVVHEFLVTEVTEYAVAGEGEEIPIGEIRQLEVQRADPWAYAAMGYGVLLIITLVGLGATLAV